MRTTGAARALCTLTLATLAAARCVDDDDCNGGGRCDLASHTCRCVRGFTGDTCALLHLGKAWKCGEGGMCINETAGSPVGHMYATWGGGVMKGKETPPKYHMYAAGMTHGCPLDPAYWMYNSIVVHGVGDSIHGPFKAAGIALGQEHPVEARWDGFLKHNPFTVQAPDGRYLIYYMGTTATGAESMRCDGAVPPSPPRRNATGFCDSDEKRRTWPECNQRVGVAWADDPNGPWTKSEAPILNPGAPGTWDDIFTTNPSVHVFQNGSALMIYKSRCLEAADARMYTGVAWADHYLGPFHKVSKQPFALTDATCEDAGMHYDANLGVFRLILHCGRAPLPVEYLYMWSRDGHSWKQLPPQPYADVVYQDGTRGTLLRRERPQWLQNERGELTHLISGVTADGVHGTQSWTMMAELI